MAVSGKLILPFPDENDLRTKQLFTETKRIVLAIIRVQTGKNLLDVLEAPVTEREEATFTDIAKKEVEAQAARRAFELRSTQQLKGSNAALNGSVGDLTKSNTSIPRSQSTLVPSTTLGSKETLLRTADWSR